MTAFSHDDVFPLIARVITTRSREEQDYVGHREIVDALMSDPVGCVVVEDATARAPGMDTEREVARNMVSWFSKRITEGSSPWTDYFERTRRNNAWAYLAKSVAFTEFPYDEEVRAIEGEPRLYFHLRRERDPNLVAKKRDAVRAEAGQLSCEVCDTRTQDLFDGLEIYEVHHRRPLAEAAGPTTTALEDLAILCPTCHQAIHKTKPLMSVATFKSRFFTTTTRELPAN